MQLEIPNKHYSVSEHIIMFKQLCCVLVMTLIQIAPIHHDFSLNYNIPYNLTDPQHDRWQHIIFLWSDTNYVQHNACLVFWLKK